MALTKSVITGRVPLPTDVAAKAAELIFTLSSWDTQGADVIAPATVRAILGPDASLPAGFALWRNTEGLRGSHYIVTARWTEEDRSRGAVSRETRLGNIQIGDDASYPLAVLLERGIDPAPPSFWVAASAGDVQTIVEAANALGGYTEPGYLAEVQAGAASAATSQTAAAGSAAQAQVAAANAQSSALTVATWAALVALTSTVAGTGAEVLDTDTGTHTDPVVGGTVANAGRYSWSVTPAGWRRIGDRKTGETTMYETLDPALPDTLVLGTDGTVVYGKKEVSQEAVEGLQADVEGIFASGPMMYETLDPATLDSVLLGTDGTLIYGLDGGGGSEEVAEPVPAYYGVWRMSDVVARVNALTAGVTDEWARLVMAFIGDSYSHKATRWVLKRATAMWRVTAGGQVAPIGRGFISFSKAGSASDAGDLRNGCITDNGVVTSSSGWTTTYALGTGPDYCQTTASVAGEYHEVSLDYSKGFRYRLGFKGATGSSMRYRWNDTDDWKDIDGLGAGSFVTTYLDLTADKPTSGSGVFRIEVVAGSPVLYGLVEDIASVGGVLAHKIAATGSQMVQRATVSQANHTANHVALGTNLAFIMDGANAQTAYSKEQFKAATLTVIDRLLTANPAMTIVLVAEPENGKGYNTPMIRFQEAFYEIARDLRPVVFLNLQPFFGETYSDYSPNSARPLIGSDDLHPTDGQGGFTMDGAVSILFGPSAQ